MTKDAFHKLVKNEIVILDGSTGSCLTNQGMPKNVCVEAWILEHPELLQKLQSEYIEAGSQIVYAPTFSANRISLERHSLSDQVERLNEGLVAISKKIADGRALVAGDMTTTGEILEPVGELEEEELFQVYCQQVRSLWNAGADLIIGETLLSVQEGRILADAVHSVCDLPVMVSLTVQADGRGLFGGSAVDAVKELGEKADAVGINCSLGPAQLVQIVKDMKAAAGDSVPLLVKPNAGLPVNNPDGTLSYPMGPEEFGQCMKVLVEAGANLVGGCCGTSPEYIRELVSCVK